MKGISWRAVGIVLLAFGLRLVSLDARAIWYDEAFSVFLAERGPAAIVSGTAADTMPPGYYLLLSGWMNAVGQSPLAMRMLSVILSVLTVAMVYAVAKRGFGERAGMWAAFLAALLPFQIYHAQELRMYTLLALGVMVYLYGVLELTLRRGMGAPWRAIAFIAVGTVMALYAHNLAFTALLAGNLFFVLKREWRKEGWLIVGQATGAIFFAPWVLYLPTQLEKIQRAFWTQQPGALEVVQMVMEFTAYLPLPPLLIVVALVVGILVLVLTAWEVFKMARTRSYRALGLFVTFVLVPPVLMFVISYLIRPVFVPRGAIGSALVYAMLVGAVLARGGRWVQVGAAALVVALMVGLLPFYYAAWGEWRRAPYAEADAYLEAAKQDGDVVLHDNKLSFLPMHFYDRALAQEFLADPPQTDNDTFAPASQQAMNMFPTEWDAAVDGAKRVWFVIYQTAIDEAGGAHANVAKMDERFRRVDEKSYGDVRIFLYASR